MGAGGRSTITPRPLSQSRASAKGRAGHGRRWKCIRTTSYFPTLVPEVGLWLLYASMLDVLLTSLCTKSISSFFHPTCGVPLPIVEHSISIKDSSLVASWARLARGVLAAISSCLSMPLWSGRRRWSGWPPRDGSLCVSRTTWALIAPHKWPSRATWCLTSRLVFFVLHFSARFPRKDLLWLIKK